ncbi:kinase-like domain-containing protein [Mariannaea sp. PMI_226]|nr:kinase-like domain-containing protein [Mariannaea sp. PMI_226]
MNAYLRFPFRSLSCENIIGRGSGGHVVIISEHVVFKFPTIFDNPAPQQRAEMEESAERIENEKNIYATLQMNQHPHIVLSPRSIQQGIFLHRQAITLRDRLDQAPSNPLPHQSQERWIRQLSSALAWLEKLDLVHGDLRPANIFLTASGNDGRIKLGDFDSAFKTGTQLCVASEPFCKLLEDYQVPIGNHITEQFSLGSCIYSIRFQHIPWHNIDPPVRVCKLMHNEFPETSSDIPFGEVIKDCWHGRFNSVHAVEEEVVRLLREKMGATAVAEMLGCINPDLTARLDVECGKFLKQQSMYS